MLKIVIVEDEYIIRSGLCNLIPRLKESFQVVGNAENGYEGVQLISRIKPDVVICDIRMKVMDGLEMIRQLRDMKIDCKYIILSGYSDFAYAQKAISLGVYGYLLKPVNSGELLEILIKAEGDFELILQESDTEQENYSSLISSAIREIRDHYQSDISLSGIAELLGVTNAYLSVRFLKETGDNFTEYLRNYRMEKACELIQNTDKKMYEIALQVGYDNPQYFSSVFKSVMGMSPKSYMRECKKE